MSTSDEIKILAFEKSEITEKRRKDRTDGTFYRTFYVTIPADEFLPYAKSMKKLSETVWEYSDALFERMNFLLKEQPLPDEFRIMDKNHIHNETMAHLLPWFVIARKLKFGVLYKSCKEVDLNIDERRQAVKLLMKIGSLI